MLNIILSIFPGWPAIVLTLILATVGLFKRDHRLLVAGAILSFPFSFAVSGFPSFRFPAFSNNFLPLFLFGSGFFMWRNREMPAAITAIPFCLVVMLLWLMAQAGGA